MPAAERDVILVVGLSHETAGLAAREQVALDDVAARGVLQALAATPALRESFVLSTCNRTEIYAVGRSRREGERALREAYLRHTRVGAATMNCSAYSLSGKDAVEHLFRVACGLESAILGETEIAAQLRAAGRRAEEEGTLGTLLEAALAHALSAARRARRSTGISAGATSIATVVSQVVRRGTDAGGQRRVVLVGAGRLARALAAPLAAEPGTELVVLNRTPAAARDIAPAAADYGGLDRLPAELAGADVLVTAVDSPLPLVNAAAVAGARRPLLVVDLGVPRNVDPAAASVPGVTLHDIDAVQQMVSRNVKGREHEAASAARVLRREVERFERRRRELEAAPVLRSLWQAAEELRRAELARVSEGMSADELERLDRASAALVRKLLHGPSRRLREACGMPSAASHLESVRMLFALDAAPSPAAARGNVVALRQEAA